MLKVSKNQRYLVREDGQPFFYLGDTAWELFHRLDRDEAGIYLADRAAKGFTAVQAVVLAELKGCTDPNPYGHLPLIDNNLAKPNEKYFEHVDYIVNKANSLGLYISMLPSWGDKVGRYTGGDGLPNLITESNARAYGEYLGRRYSKNDIIWVLGGDRTADGCIEIYNELAAGLRTGDGGRGLITYHPIGQYSSAHWFNESPWLDFHMFQTGHTLFRMNYIDAKLSYELRPIRPFIDGEPGYEDMPSGFNPANGYLNDFHCRNFFYWSVFSGAAGHTYGCHNIWQMFELGRREPQISPRKSWRESLSLPGAEQMGFARRLIESRPFLSRIPDQSLVYLPPAFGLGHVTATRDGTPGRNDATYAMIYASKGRDLPVRTERIAAETLNGWWFDPRTGKSTPIGRIENADKRTFTTPNDAAQQDWVLVLDEASKNYPQP